MDGLPRVDSLWAWICTDIDGTEAIPAFTLPNGATLPMVAIRRSVVEKMRPKAMEFAANGRKMALVEFAARITHETLDPAMPVEINE